MRRRESCRPNGGFALHEASQRRVAGVSNRLVVQFPPTSISGPLKRAATAQPAPRLVHARGATDHAAHTRPPSRHDAQADTSADRHRRTTRHPPPTPLPRATWPYTGHMHDPTLSTAQHRELVEALALSHVLPHETLPVEECLGRRLAVDISSLIPLPPFTNSAMDGFAVRREDLEGEGPWTLPVAGDIPAGDTRENHLEKGQAWRIMTGAPIPAGADTVVKVGEPAARASPATRTFSPSFGATRISTVLGASFKLQLSASMKMDRS